MKIVVVVPTYNERGTIEPLIAGLQAAFGRIPQHEGVILVVDDSSPDGTGAAVRDLQQRMPNLHLLSGRKQGLGVAYARGLQYALDELDAHAVVHMDADFSHDPAHLPQFLAAVENADLVLGSRYQEGRVTVVNWPINRLILSYLANMYARAITGLHVWDATGGFKCFRRSVLEAIDLDHVRSNGYAFQIEMTFRAVRKHFRIAEIPIVFVDRTEGTSKMSKHIVREAVWMVWRLRWWALRGII